MNSSMWRQRRISTTSLLLDPENPRIPPSGRVLTQRDLIAELVEHDDVYDVAKSIADHGYFVTEVLVAVMEDKKPVVVEGNRRLAACKLLLVPDLLKGNEAKKFKALSARADLNLIRRLQVVVAPDRLAAVPLLISRHTNPKIARWVPTMQANFYRKLVDRRLTIDDVAREFNVSAGELRNQLFVHNLYAVACAMPTPDVVASFVRDPREFPVSTLERLMTSKAGQSALGFSVASDGEISGVIDKAEFAKGMVKILTDMQAGFIDSRVLNDEEKIKAYFKNWRIEEKPDTSKPGNFNSGDFDGPSKPDSHAPPKLPSLKPPRAEPFVGKGLIPRGFECQSKSPRVQDLYAELRKLSVREYRNCVAVGLRVLLELSVYTFLHKSGEVAKMRADRTAKVKARRTEEKAKNPALTDSQIADKLKFPANDCSPDLKDMLAWIVKQNLASDPQITKALPSLMKDELFDMNLLVHNHTFNPDEPTLRRYWASVAPLLVEIWSR